MDIHEYIPFLNTLYNSNHMPICLFQGDTIILQNPEISGSLDRFLPAYHAMKMQNKDITYLITSYDAYCGLIRLKEPDAYIFAGPFFLTPITEDRLPILLNAMRVPESERSTATVFLNGAPYGPLHRFLSGLSCLHFAVNHVFIPIEEISNDTENFKSDEEIHAQFTQDTYDAREHFPKHTTYLHEMRRMELIASGNTEGMKRDLITPLPGEQGRVANDGLRQAKNIFISACTLYSRAAIAGGMDVEEAYNLSDVFIRTIESYTNVADVEHLLQKMPLAFTKRVEEKAKYSHVSPPIMTAIHYITAHIDQPLQSETIAAQANLSTSHFLKRFKAETGMGLSEFITNVRIEEACILLTYTDKSLTEISTYLDFSSQSYFQNVFKRVMGVTPGQYRNTNQVPVFLRKQ